MTSWCIYFIIELEIDIWLKSYLSKYRYQNFSCDYKPSMHQKSATYLYLIVCVFILIHKRNHDFNKRTSLGENITAYFALSKRREPIENFANLNKRSFRNTYYVQKQKSIAESLLDEKTFLRFSKNNNVGDFLPKSNLFFGHNGPTMFRYSD